MLVEVVRMRLPSQLILAAAAAAAAIAALPSPSAAVPVASAFQVRGMEVAASSTRGTFVGTASGRSGTRGGWRAVVEHTPLGSRPASITGGGLRMAAIGSSLSPETIRASFSGGSIAVVDPGGDCGRQTFAVHGSLIGLTTGTSKGGSGVLDATLTHYRVRVLGRCVAYAASISGRASFSY